jgi:adenylate cyclase
LVEEGSDLIGSFIAGETLLLRVRGVGSVQTEWRARLKELVVRQATHSGPIAPEQNRLFEQYTSVLHSLSTRQPMLLILDDLHWADVASISLLFHLGRRIDQRRILIIGSYRPEDVAQGSSGQPHPLDGVLSEFKRHFGDTWLDLDQAGAGAGGRAFVDALLDSEANRLGEAFRQALYQHSRGQPLFTVELLRDMQERGNLVQDDEDHWVEGSKLDWEAMPARVEGVIEKRISRLDTELQEALNVASIEGEAFTAEVVAQVQRLDERGLVRRLSGELDKQHRLVQEQGLQHVGTLRLSRYQFRHNLFQKYLYDRLGQAERAYLHEAVGNTLETLYQNQTEEIAVQLARHFQEAGLMDKAIDCLLQAGQRATRLSANEEAIGHINQGLVLLKSLPDTLGRAQQELTLLLALSRPLTRLKGYSAPDVEQTYRRAWEICQQIGDTPERFPVLRGLWDYHLVRAEGYKAHELGRQFLEMARRVDDPTLLMEAHWLLGETLFFMGEITAALTHQEQAIARYSSQQYRAYPYRAAQDPGLASRYFRAENLWFLGYPDQALATIHDTLTLAQDLAQPFEIANTLFAVIKIYQARHEVQAAQTHVENFVALSKEHGFEMWVPISMGQRGWLLAGQGQLEEGIVQMEQGLTAHLEATAGGLGLSMSAHTRVETYARARHVEKGLEFLSEVLSEVEKSGYRLYEAELYRLKGKLLQMQGTDKNEVEACFRQAIDIARRQQAKSLELRATVSLSRLLQKQDKPDEARQMLAEIYSWFSEGFDTADLIEARELLEELNGSTDRSAT